MQHVNSNEVMFKLYAIDSSEGNGTVVSSHFLLNMTASVLKELSEETTAKWCAKCWLFLLG